MRGHCGCLDIVVAFVMMLLASLTAAEVHAASVEKLLMPGKLSHAHVKQEDNCGSCHDRSNTVTQTSLCLDCHKDVAEDLRSHLNFHGRMPNAGRGECRACHSEHKGRNADISQMDAAQFDHASTQFSLDGAHAALDCQACHRRGDPWRKASSQCADCHRTDDVHHGQLSQACGVCHVTSSWSGGKFDHDTTHFHLSGAHIPLSCDACHVGGRYKSTPATCVGCHATDDEHRGSLGPECGDCHTTKEWKTAKFDHLKETGYALLGAHADIDCRACHRSGNFKDKTLKDCDGCHRADDAHAHRFGARCGDCHGNDRWRPVAYDHAARHKFPLVGAHAKLDCHTCHADTAAKKLAVDCEGCHRSESPHAGKVRGKCADCHGQESWRSALVFDHDLSSYPLLGLHRVVGCVLCHATRAFGDAPGTCKGCHAQDDVHKGHLGDACDACHSPNGWSLWHFDHAKDAHFALLGAHGKLDCGDCHRRPPDSEKLSQQCDACHHKDDRHLGQYGAQCGRCHSNYSWKGARIQ